MDAIESTPRTLTWLPVPGEALWVTFDDVISGEKAPLGRIFRLRMRAPFQESAVIFGVNFGVFFLQFFLQMCYEVPVLLIWISANLECRRQIMVRKKGKMISNYRCRIRWCKFYRLLFWHYQREKSALKEFHFQFLKHNWDHNKT